MCCFLQRLLLFLLYHSILLKVSYLPKENKYNNMSNIKPIKTHLLAKRFKIMKFLISEEYNGTEIGAIFNMDKSVVSRILEAGEKYKSSVKNLLRDR